MRRCRLTNAASKEAQWPINDNLNTKAKGNSERSSNTPDWEGASGRSRLEHLEARFAASGPCYCQ